ncbi:DNA/RNA helicase domain-containing protein [Nocardiopsis quinghaiensis]|uniref:DNA/RNA helicase domain-containing protein n=1 Tax=Nocardiopsis quinghaiensis TaxID=464995 RepID=UPI0037441BF0
MAAPDTGRAIGAHRCQGIRSGGSAQSRKRGPLDAPRRRSRTLCEEGCPQRRRRAPPKGSSAVVRRSTAGGRFRPGRRKSPPPVRPPRAQARCAPPPPETAHPRVTEAIGQVGCVQTAQGFEYDWAGVIIGPDARIRNGRLITCNGANKDQGVPPTSLTEEQASPYIRHSYEVLLTRALRGRWSTRRPRRPRRVLKELVPPLKAPADSPATRRRPPGEQLSLFDAYSQAARLVRVR